jgi:hypothetical protein
MNYLGAALAVISLSFLYLRVVVEVVREFKRPVSEVRKWHR